MRSVEKGRRGAVGSRDVEKGKIEKGQTNRDHCREMCQGEIGEIPDEHHEHDENAKDREAEPNHSGGELRNRTETAEQAAVIVGQEKPARRAGEYREADNAEPENGEEGDEFPSRLVLAQGFAGGPKNHGHGEGHTGDQRHSSRTFFAPFGAAGAAISGRTRIPGLVVVSVPITRRGNVQFSGGGQAESPITFL